MTRPTLHTFQLDYPPSLWAMYTVARGRLVLTKRGREWKERAAWQAVAQGVRVPIEGAVAVEIVVHPPASSTPQDVDNSLKGPLDCLRGLAFDDDAEVSELHVYRRPPTVAARLELTIASVDVAGLVLCRAKGLEAIEGGLAVDVMDLAKEG